ncbi:flagellar biosynthesis protein FlgL [Pelagivirga sediminicola]|uniref:Flagellar biosynthesis protein FlgL n=1 Tax=Pelagivirga sediminicola TaxID=2170575 RepID=A0A2T7G8D3_9RHOB|nr:flagellin [Pelagivirga sediminicola]PVA10666.1 flagellar biosynthesis protein FlgL [Pelagivirga sediminicola]
MSFPAIGDLAQFMTTRRQSATLQSRLGQLTQELSSGQTADVTRRVGASFGTLSDIEHRLTLNAAQKTASAEAAVQATTMQTALGMVHAQLTEISGATIFSTGIQEGGAFDAAATAARGGLDAMISALNTHVAGRPVFSGTDLASAPLISGDEMMNAARSAVSGASDAAGVIAALDTFFDTPGGGFRSIAYKGGDQDMSPFRLGAGESVQLSVRADDPALRSAMKSAVMAALAGDDGLTLAQGQRGALMQAAGAAILSDTDALTHIRSDLGHAEARIDRAMARNSAEETSLSMMRNKIMSVDMFETASALEQVQLQLETIYTLTARTSRLNLVNFL